MSLLTPYAAYLPAEVLGASGVLAAVTAGLYLGRRASRIMGSDVRLAAPRRVGDARLPPERHRLSPDRPSDRGARARDERRRRCSGSSRAGLAVSVALIAVRALWIIGMAAWQRLGSRRGSALSPAEVVVLSWSGMRGVVSLAAALAVPFALPSGSPLPAREAVIVITFTVILVTLVGQGVSLPLVIRGGPARPGRGRASRGAAGAPGAGG